MAPQLQQYRSAGDAVSEQSCAERAGEVGRRVRAACYADGGASVGRRWMTHAGERKPPDVVSTNGETWSSNRIDHPATADPPLQDGFGRPEESSHLRGAALAGGGARRVPVLPAGQAAELVGGRLPRWLLLLVFSPRKVSQRLPGGPCLLGVVVHLKGASLWRWWSGREVARQ